MSMRRRVVTSDPSTLLPHDHVAWNGAGPAALDQVAMLTFAGAARRGERMLFVADDPNPTRLSRLDDLHLLVESGALQFASPEEIYRVPIDSGSQRAEFEDVLDDALAEGYTGICVVADNSGLATGSDDDFASWLAWEATADCLQATHSISGVCFFDTNRVPEERMADIAVLHPVLSAGFVQPGYRIFADEGVLRLIGELDSFCVEQLHRIMHSAPQLTERVLDVSDVGFIDHQSLLALDCAARQRGHLRIRGARPIVRRTWELLDMPAPALEFC